MTMVEAAAWCDKLVRGHVGKQRVRSIDDFEASGINSGVRVLLDELNIDESELEIFTGNETVRVVLQNAQLGGAGLNAGHSLLMRGIVIGAAYERLRQQARAEA